jgi:hypothetical protein
MFDLGQQAPDPTYFDLSTTVPGAKFKANAVRIVAENSTATYLLVGGVDAACCIATSAALLVYGSVAAGATEFQVIGSAKVPSTHGGITALSQTSPLRPNSVLAATDEGVFKCASLSSRLRSY